MEIRGVLICAVLTSFMEVNVGSLTNCDEARKVFQLKQIGPVKYVPETPRTETVESLVRQAENYTHTVLLHTYRDLSHHAAGPVGEFFTDVNLFALGSELSLEEASQRFFDALFPLVYERLVEPGLSRLTPAYGECVRAACRDLAPFAGAPGRLAAHVSRASTPGRVFLQALHLGVEVINTTDHIQISRECRRALLRMNYCPHCQGLTASEPCTGYCLNVMRGCLASLAEVDSHWREFVRSLEALETRTRGGLDLEQVLLGVHGLVRDAVAHAQKNAPRLSAQVHKVCGRPSRRQAQVSSVQHGTSGRNSIPLKGPVRNTDDTLSHRRNYTLRVVGNGIKAQAENPEVKVKEVDPVISQVIDKLKHINQLLQGRPIPKFGTLDQIETGSGDGYSGDCDDEDGCWGSGSGPKDRRTVTLSLFSQDVYWRSEFSLVLLALLCFLAFVYY
ncbi:glypican 5a precursor [Triplophysa rosa]|uniref:Glypican 5a n=1 Tax=Triplophysa rosa TaxID=992332 RepID=A0A9W7WZA6_TRIRA|nr:glypican 5a precursor [Triplophysa rosa]